MIKKCQKLLDFSLLVIFMVFPEDLI